MKKRLFILCGVVLTVYMNSLFNGFSGDDQLLFINNSFFHSWSNLRMLFASGYNTNPVDIFNNTGFFSGSVAYRPVLSLSFFVDWALWKSFAQGYHVQNVLFHVFNVILVFLLGRKIFSGSSRDFKAFWTAIFFGVMPLNSEAVCAIGFRADVLAMFFVLSAMLFYLLHDERSGRFERTLYLAASYASYFLAVFSKESAVVFPVIFLIYDMIFKHPHKVFWKRVEWKRQLGYWAIMAGYVFLYTQVFVNKMLGQVPLLGEGVFGHAIRAVEIFGYYMLRAFLPWTVKILPPVFSFPEEIASVVSPWDLAGIAFLGTVLLILWRALKDRKMVWFGFLWMMIGYAPVSNLLPVVTPIAHRFFYLPALGFSIILVELLKMAGDSLERRHFAQTTFVFTIWAVLCAVFTIALNSAWKSNYLNISHMIKDFPKNGRSQLLMGIVYDSFAEPYEAIHCFEKAEQLGFGWDPRIVMAGENYERIGRAEKALEVYNNSIQEYPDLYFGYLGVGRFLFKEKNYQQALIYLKEGYARSPRFELGGYMIQCYRLLGDEAAAGEAYREIAVNIEDNAQKSMLKSLVERPVFELPVLLGH